MDPTEHANLIRALLSARIIAPAVLFCAAKGGHERVREQIERSRAGAGEDADASMFTAAMALLFAGSRMHEAIAHNVTCDCPGIEWSLDITDERGQPVADPDGTAREPCTLTLARMYCALGNGQPLTAYDLWVAFTRTHPAHVSCLLADLAVAAVNPTERFTHV